MHAPRGCAQRAASGARARTLQGGQADEVLRQRAQPVAVHGELLQAGQPPEAGRQLAQRIVRHVEVLQRLPRARAAADPAMPATRACLAEPRAPNKRSGC